MAEAAVVGRPDDTHRRGDLRLRRAEAARARPATRRKKIAKELRDWVGKEIGPIAKPKDIRFGDNLPKTRSRQDHAPPAALDRQGRGDHAGRLDAGESGDPRAVETGEQLTHRSASSRRAFIGQGQRLLAVFGALAARPQTLRQKRTRHA